MSDPKLTLILASPYGWQDLALALPGIQAQTMAKDIELLIIAKPGAYPDDLNDRISGLHSVRVVEAESFAPRNACVARAIPEARAPYFAPHENHAYAEPETYETLVNAMTEETGCLAPVYHVLNSYAPWGCAVSVITHGHAAAPVSGERTPVLALHSAVYPTKLLIPRAEEFGDEAKLHRTLYEEGYHVGFLPGTVLWHMEAGNAAMAFAVTQILGRQFGWARSKDWGWPERILRAAAYPAIAAISAKRYLLKLLELKDTQHMKFRLIPHVGMLAATFAYGEVRGYFTFRNPWPEWADWHEYEFLERLEGAPKPDRRSLIDAVARFNDPIPAQTAAE
ncbi:MAG: hypothetical protein AAF566_02075 [Pseudomonadota bacterium]